MSVHENEKGILTVISGFSGAGKGTVIKSLLKNYPEIYRLSISATTRLPRNGEKEGREYFFKTTEEFEQMIQNGELIEYASYVNHYYGTPKDFVQKQMDCGKDVILEIEVQGALKVKEKYPGALLIFVTPPDAGRLVAQLHGRGTENEETIQKRLCSARTEADFIPKYDYLVVNDVPDECAESIHRIAQAHHCTPDCRASLVRDLKQQLIQQCKE